MDSETKYGSTSNHSISDFGGGGEEQAGQHMKLKRDALPGWSVGTQLVIDGLCGRVAYINI